MQNARKIAFKDNNPISSELGHNAKKCSAKKMFLFREKSCPFVIWQALNQLTTIDSGHINLENLLKLTIRKSVNKTGIFREKSDKKMEVYTQNPNINPVSWHLAYYTALWSLLQIGGWYIMIVVYDDDFTEVSPCQM